jgi:predicted TPR repeat methyltransferase
MNYNALITPAYREMQRELHAAPRGYGQRGDKWAPVVRHLCAEYDASSLLDYGCGQGALARVLTERNDLPGIRISEYDPAIAGKDGKPSFADIVVSTDVLEHIEIECLDAVLAHIRMLARKAVFVVVSTCETAKTLSDGRNAHLIVESGLWWRARLEFAGFTVLPPPAITRDRSDKEWVGVLLP